MIKRVIVCMLIVASSVYAKSKNCELMAEMIDMCVKEKGSCKEKAIAMKIGLERAGLDVKTQEKLLQGCLNACMNPVSWIKADFLTRCRRVEK